MPLAETIRWRYANLLFTQAPKTTKVSSQSTRAALLPGERDLTQESAATEADLECPKKLIKNAAGCLLGSFNEFAALEPKTSRNHAERRRIAMAIGSAVNALHLHHMVEQLEAYAQRRLVAGENCLRSLYGGRPMGDCHHGRSIRSPYGGPK